MPDGSCRSVSTDPSTSSCPTTGPAASSASHRSAKGQSRRGLFEAANFEAALRAAAEAGLVRKECIERQIAFYASAGERTFDAKVGPVERPRLSRPDRRGRGDSGTHRRPRPRAIAGPLPRAGGVPLPDPAVRQLLRTGRPRRRPGAAAAPADAGHWRAASRQARQHDDAGRAHVPGRARLSDPGDAIC